ncbi:MAG: hypothetical protein ACD_30C00098G0003 [uncultured bacterium]|nr:MAG: hypothetical protein ACD_30C00098G0003 [uncultured bacterium]
MSPFTNPNSSKESCEFSLSPLTTPDAETVLVPERSEFTSISPAEIDLSGYTSLAPAKLTALIIIYSSS